ncbi:MAG: tetratricopeptide repeat protein [Phycisphaerae bacterium]
MLLALPAAAAALIAQRDGGDMLNLATHSLWSRLAQATYGLMFYPWKTLVPLGLGPLYEIPPWADLMGPMLWISLAVVIGLGVAAYRLRRTVPAIAAVLAVYAVIVFPVLGFAQSGPQLVADRYSYLSCLGFPLLMGAALQRLLRNACCGPGSQQRWILSLICVSVISVLARAGFHQNDYWLSAETLWRRGVVVSPQSSIAHTNYADALARSSDYGKAYGHYQQALRLNPADAVALHHLGDLSFATGNDNVAIDYLLQSLRIDPNRRRACLLLGRLLDKQGRYRDAARVLGDGARRHPDDLDLAGQLARLLATCPDESIREPGHAVTLALRVNRARYFRSIPALTTLAAAYAADGQFDRAVETIRRALALTDAADNPTLFAHLSDRLQRYRDEQPPSPRRG